MYMLSDAIREYKSHPNNTWLYLPSNNQWIHSSMAAVMEMKEVPPEMEDDDIAGRPQYAIDNNLIEVIESQTLKSIIDNLIVQNPSASEEDMFNAFIFFYENDAFIIL